MKISISPAFNQIINELNSAGTGRGIAVLRGSFIEGMTLSLLQAALVPSGPIKNYLENAPKNAKQKFAFLVGLIRKTLNG